MARGRGGRGRSGRRYVRDNRGRFATTGATARGGRLKTASGKKRETQTMKVSGAKAAGTISKPKGLKPGTIKAKPKSSSARKQAASSSIKKTGILQRPARSGRLRTENKLPGVAPRSGRRSTKPLRTRKPASNIKPLSPGQKLRLQGGAKGLLKKVRTQADDLKKSLRKSDESRLNKALKKPSVTDKRSRDYLGKLTKEGKRQDPATGGKKTTAKKAASKKPATQQELAASRLKIKTATRRKLKTDRSSVIPEKPKARRVKGSRPASTVAKKPRAKGNDPKTVAGRIDRKAAVNQANIKNIIRAERTGATQGRQYERALKTQATLKRAQEFTKTGKLPGRDNSIKAQRERRAASQRLAAKNAERKAARQAASKPKTSRRAKRTVSPEKVERIAGRLNKVATTKGGREGVKALNRTQVAVRAKSFLSRKAGGVSGLNAMGNKAAQLKSVKSSIDTRRKYSTQKPNRNKPGKFDDLGQGKLRAKNKAAQAKPASPNLGKPAQVTSRGRTIKPAENFKPAVKGKSAPDNARTRANKLKTAQNKVRMYSETSSRSAQNAIANRNAALKARPQGTPGKVIFRSKNRASSRFQQRANDLTTRIKSDLKHSKPGTFSATGGGGGKGITRRNTGDKQTSMFGKPAPLYTNKTAKSVKRRSGKRK